MKRRCVLAFALAMVCGARHTTPVVAAASGDTPPHRIVSLIPAVTQILFAIGAGDRVIAVSNFDREPAGVEKLARVGGLLDPDTERILALRPDLVIVYEAQRELEQRLSQAHIRYYEYAHKDLANVMATMRALGAIVGTADTAERAARGIEQKLQAIAARVAGRPRPLVLLVLSRDPQSLRNIYANGGYGFLHDMIEIAGGRDLFDDIKRENVQPSTEQILARRPEVIIELRYGAATVGRDDLSSWRALASIPAVRTNRLYELVGDRFVEAGPHVADAAEQFARTLHPEVFK